MIIPDKRDRVWLDLDGPALFYLGHIAAIHINIDLVSIEEGEKWINKLNLFYEEAKWPAKENLLFWKKYIDESRVGYDFDESAFPC